MKQIVEEEVLKNHFSSTDDFNTRTDTQSIILSLSLSRSLI